LVPFLNYEVISSALWVFEFCVVNAGDEATNSIDSDWSMDCSAGAVVRVKTLHISSPILAAKSPFFYKVWISLSL